MGIVSAIFAEGLSGKWMSISGVRSSKMTVNRTLDIMTSTTHLGDPGRNRTQLSNEPTD
jgi:hypothetical protein